MWPSSRRISIPRHHASGSADRPTSHQETNFFTNAKGIQIDGNVINAGGSVQFHYSVPFGGLARKNYLGAAALRPLSKVLMLADTQESREDMRLILTSGFDSIRRRRQSVVGGRQWPYERYIDKNKNISSAEGQFIYVLTILRWLDDDEGDPVNRIQCIFKTPNDEKAHAFAPLDRLYNAVVTSACSKKTGDLVLPCLLLITATEDQCRLKDLQRLSHLLGIKLNHLQIALQPLHSVLKMPKLRFDGIEVYHRSFTEYLYDSTRSGDYCISNFMPKVTTSLLPKAIRWANADVLEPDAKRFMLWLHLQDSIPEKNFSFTPELLNTLARVNASHWLRVGLLFAPFSWTVARNNYNGFQRRLAHCLPEEERDRLHVTFPHDLFPPPGPASVESIVQHVLCNCVRDLQSGMLSPKEVVVFLYILFSYATVGRTNEALDASCEPSRHRDTLTSEDIVYRCISGGGVNLLPSQLHTCKARNLVLGAREYLASKHTHDVQYLLSHLATRRCSDLPPIMTTLMDSIFTPVDILCSAKMEEHRLFHNSVWYWLKRRSSEPTIRVDRLKFIVPQYHQFPEAFPLLEACRNVIPTSLLALLSDPGHVDLSELDSTIDKEIAKLPIECNCDEMLGLEHDWDKDSYLYRWSPLAPFVLLAVISLLPTNSTTV